MLKRILKLRPKILRTLGFLTILFKINIISDNNVYSTFKNEYKGLCDLLRTEIRLQIIDDSLTAIKSLA